MSIEIHKPIKTQFWVAKRPDGSFDYGETEPNQVTTSGAEVFQYGDTAEIAIGKLDPKDVSQARTAVELQAAKSISNELLLEQL